MIMVKYGGHAMVDHKLSADFAREVVALERSGQKVVIVHGGGPQIEAELKSKSITSTSVAGLRVTTPEMMNIVEMVLTGRVLRDVTNLILQAGGNAVGITGRDAHLLVAKKVTHSAIGEPIEVGQVGEIIEVNSGILTTLIDAGFIPIVAPSPPILKGVHSMSMLILQREQLQEHFTRSAQSSSLMFPDYFEIGQMHLRSSKRFLIRMRAIFSLLYLTA